MAWAETGTVVAAAVAVTATVVGFRRRRRGSFRLTVTVERDRQGDDTTGRPGKRPGDDGRAGDGSPPPGRMAGPTS